MRAVKGFPGGTDEKAYGEPLVRWLLALLLGWAVFRLFRGLFVRPVPPPISGNANRRGLDPDRAVTAKWSEIEEEKGDG